MDKIDRKPETEEEIFAHCEVIEELRRRLAHKATVPPPVCRVRALGAFEARAEDELSSQPVSIITVQRLSEASPGWKEGLSASKHCGDTRLRACWARRADSQETCSK